MVRHYCTYCDRHYLCRALALYHSMVRHCQPFTLWILCFDRYTYRTLDRLQLSCARLISQEEFERDDAPLRHAKENRNRVEYYWTCTPSLPLFVFGKAPDVAAINYVDSDLYFFGDPAPLYSECGSSSILIIGHRFPDYLKDMDRWGKYNVGFLSFRRDANGIACLQWWREQCLEWCYRRLEDSRMGDQKYLDDWPERFRGVCVLQHRGSNVAPWNLSTYPITATGDRVYISADPLVFFHFQGLKIINSRLFYCGYFYRRTMTTLVKRLIYMPYLRELRKAIVDLEATASRRGLEEASESESEDVQELVASKITPQSILRLPRALFQRSIVLLGKNEPHLLGVE